MTFREATDQLTAGISLANLAARMNVAVNSVLRARMEGPNARKPPEGWEQALAQLARERARDLQQLAETLEPSAPQPVKGELATSRPFPYNAGTGT